MIMDDIEKRGESLISDKMKYEMIEVEKYWGNKFTRKSGFIWLWYQAMNGKEAAIVDSNQAF